MLNIFKNPLVVSWLNSLIGLLSFIVIVPVASEYFTETQFTLWLFSSSVIAIAIIFETSVSVVFTRMLTGYLEAEKLEALKQGSDELKDAISGFLISSCVLYAAAASLGGVFAWLVARVSVGGLVELGLAESEARSTIIAFGVAAGSSIILSYPRSILIAIRKLHMQRVFMLTNTAFKVILSLLLIVFVSRVDVLMVLYVGLNIVESFLLLFFIGPVLRGRTIVLPKFVFLKDFVQPFLRTLVIRVGGYLTLYSSALIVVRHAPADADSYLLSFRLAQAGASVSMIPVSICLPALARLRKRILVGENEASDFVESALRVIFFGVTCMLLLLGVLLFVGPSLIEYVSSKSLLPFTALSVLCLVFFFDGHNQAHAMVYETQNKVPYFLVSLCSGISILVLSYYLVPVFSIWGALIAMVAALVAVNGWIAVWYNLSEWGVGISVYIKTAIVQVPRPSISKLINPDS